MVTAPAAGGAKSCPPMFLLQHEQEDLGIDIVEIYLKVWLAVSEGISRRQERSISSSRATALPRCYRIRRHRATVGRLQCGGRSWTDFFDQRSVA